MNTVKIFESDFFNPKGIKTKYVNPKTYISKRKKMKSLNNAINKLWEGGMTPDEMLVKSTEKGQCLTGG